MHLAKKKGGGGNLQLGIYYTVLYFSAAGNHLTVAKAMASWKAAMSVKSNTWALGVKGTRCKHDAKKLYKMFHFNTVQVG